MIEQVSAEISVYGHVQGVGYRWFTYRIAKELGIKGYVRNEFDGSVSVFVEGDKQNIQRFESILRQGPSHSYVDKLRIVFSDFMGTFNDFNIR